MTSCKIDDQNINQSNQTSHFNGQITILQCFKFILLFIYLKYISVYEILDILLLNLYLRKALFKLKFCQFIYFCNKSFIFEKKIISHYNT